MEKAKESPEEEDMVDLAADAEEKQDADAKRKSQV